jgi:hypothetical protein
MDDEFERILAESFNNASNSYNNIPISTSEANNVNDIFVGNEVKTECIICYEDNVPCIKCFQCTAVYCKDCLTKIASESNKCICGIEIKTNYSKLKKYNQDLIKKGRENNERKKTQSTPNVNNTNRNTNNNHNSNPNPNPNHNTNRNTNRNTNTNRNKNYNDNNNNNTNYYPDIDLDLKLEFLKDLTDNKIYNIDFKSFQNKKDVNIPNFDHFWDYQNKQLIFYPISNNQDLKNIIINYNILNADYQAELYPYILELLKLPFYKFKYSWNNIADILTKTTDYNKTMMVSNIISICRCEGTS